MGRRILRQIRGAITNCRVLLIPGKIDHTRNTVNARFASVDLRLIDFNPEWELVERFSINVTVCGSVLPVDATLTRLFMHADLPALFYNLSFEKYFQLFNHPDW